jgi:hypothetical protein
MNFLWCVLGQDNQLVFYFSQKYAAGIFLLLTGQTVIPPETPSEWDEMIKLIANSLFLSLLR